MNNRSEYKVEKPEEYYSLEREDLTRHIPLGPHLVLEVGSAEGKTGLQLKKSGKASAVVGIELNEEVAFRAKKNLDFVLHGNIETDEIPIPYGKYDYVLAGDVLEHLVDPWSALKKLKATLNPNGKIIFSVPNIRNWTVLFPLLFNGEWEYEKFGIMDSTHLRFFTKKTCLQLVESANMRVVSVSPSGSRIAEKFNRIHLYPLVEFTAVQFVVVCEKGK